MTGQQALFFLYVKNRTIRRAVPVLVQKIQLSYLSLRGQQFAQQIQQQNPELIEQLRNHIRSRSFSGSAEEHSWSSQVFSF